MIPFSAISQKRYKIDGDTVIIFTPKETRKLAIKLLEGEKYEKLYLTASEIQKVQDSIISFQSYHIAIRDSLLVVSFSAPSFFLVYNVTIPTTHYLSNLI